MRALWRERSFLAALSVMHEQVGDIFEISLPGFEPVVVVGPDLNRRLLVSERERFCFRTESDAVTKLLRHGLLVEDGDEHDRLRNCMNPALHKREAIDQIPAMLEETRFVTGSWRDGETVDMLVEMRKVALVILIQTLFKIDFRPDLDRLWNPILRSLAYISPGAWIVWPEIPRIGFATQLRLLDDYLYSMIARRREELKSSGEAPAVSDLLGTLIATEGMNDDLIRDQLLTMLIAGHDTSTALFAWALWLLGSNPGAMRSATEEVDRVVGNEDIDAASVSSLDYLDWVVKEALRLYPPIHVGNRKVIEDVEFGGYHLKAGSRVMYSIYLSHRDPKIWKDPEAFVPERFSPGEDRRPGLAYVPFGGGPRNCIGAAYAQIEAKVVLGHILKEFDLELVEPSVRPHMGATLEPRPGVRMRVWRREAS
ncbi:MAG TPA: cytochrome P450 [Rhodothermales bacterium]|nr:cytochrome P450 [Rhodothermales bacterium]